MNKEIKKIWDELEWIKKRQEGFFRYIENHSEPKKECEKAFVSEHLKRDYDSLKESNEIYIKGLIEQKEKLQEKDERIKELELEKDKLIKELIEKNEKINKLDFLNFGNPCKNYQVLTCNDILEQRKTEQLKDKLYQIRECVKSENQKFRENCLIKQTVSSSIALWNDSLRNIKTVIDK